MGAWMPSSACRRSWTPWPTGISAPLFDAMSDDVTWRWMGVTSTGHNTTPDGRRYENIYRWALTFEDDLIREVREYMDTQLATEAFAADPS
jgi:hypothetical protein